MKNLITAIPAFCLFAGCFSSGMRGNPDPGTIQVPNQKVALFLGDENTNWEHVPVIGSVPELKKNVKCVCKPKVETEEDKKMAIAIPAILVASTAKLLFDLYIDNRNADLKKLKKAAQKSYSARFITKSKNLIGCSCAVLVRYSGSESEKYNIGLASVLRLSDPAETKEGFIFKPIYLKADNTVARTNKSKSKTDKSDEYLINLSFGLSVKSIGEQESGLPGVFPLGSGAVSIPNVTLGEEYLNIHEIDVKKEEYPNIHEIDVKSDIIPYPRNGDSIASVTVSITETGNVGIDFDEAEAELKAIKEAIGPAIKEYISEALKTEQ